MYIYTLYILYSIPTQKISLLIARFHRWEGLSLEAGQELFLACTTGHLPLNTMCCLVFKYCAISSAYLLCLVEVLVRHSVRVLSALFLGSTLFQWSNASEYGVIVEELCVDVCCCLLIIWYYYYLLISV